MNCSECNKPLEAKQKTVCSTPCQKAQQKRLAKKERDSLDRITLPKTRQAAILNGSKYYCKGPCKVGHDGIRYTTTAKCCDCQVEYNESRPGRAGVPLKAIAPVESLVTAPVFFHILPNWTPVVVERA